MKSSMAALLYFVAGAGKGDVLTTKTDLEASSTSKVAFGKNTYCTLFGVDMLLLLR